MAVFFKNIFGTLNDEGVKYLVAGGIAAVLYGAPRFTADIDIIIDLSEDNVIKLGRTLDKIGYVPRVPVKIEDFANPEKRQNWIDEKNMKVFQFVNVKQFMESIDVFVKNPIDFNAAYSRRKELKFQGIIIPLVSLDDLIYLKKEAARAKDLADIETLEDIKMQKKNEQ